MTSTNSRTKKSPSSNSRSNLSVVPSLPADEAQHLPSMTSWATARCLQIEARRTRKSLRSRRGAWNSHSLRAEGLLVLSPNKKSA